MFRLLSFLFLLSIVSKHSIDCRSSLPSVIKIGAIIESNHEQWLTIFRQAINRINMNQMLLPRTKLDLIAFIVKPDDTSKLLDKSIWTLFGPGSPSIDWYLRSLANERQIPHLSINWNYRSKYLHNINIKSSKNNKMWINYNGMWKNVQQLSKSSIKSYTINLYPESNQLSLSFQHFVQSRNWKSFTLIYDDNDGLIMMKDLLRISSDNSNGNRMNVKITLIRLPEIDDRRFRKLPINLIDQHRYRITLKSIKSSEHNIVLSMKEEQTIQFLQYAFKGQRMTEYDNYLIATLDFHRYDLTQFQSQTLANITGLSMLSSINNRIESTPTFDRLSNIYGKKSIAQIYNLTTTEALIHDAVTLFAMSLDDLDRSIAPGRIVSPMSSLSIPQQNNWSFGPRLINQMLKTNINGLTGPIRFDSNGNRINFNVQILQMKPTGTKNIANWSPKTGIITTINNTFYDSYKQILEAMKYKEFRITVPPNSKPYIYLKESHENYTGNDRFEGFCVDLLEKIRQVFQREFGSDFKYALKVVSDGEYGKQNGDEWNGMFGELIRHQADLAIGDLTATYLRETAVDFTMPFMNLGIAILFKKTAIPDPELFSFLKPLSIEVWLYLASAFLSISILFWILSRITPYEWISPHSCDPDPLQLENQFSIGNSLWFTIGSLMQQGSDLAPRALSTRLLASVWWFFTLIMISSYTANLAASLTLSRMAPAISNVEDLAKQTKIQYGCKKGGSTYEFFQNSNHTTYQRMFNTMENNPELYITKWEDAIERVRKGGYAYLAESSTIEYLIERKCDMFQVGTWLDNKGYGIATPPDSPYRTPISNAIVVLQDQGQLYELKKRWWVDYGGGLCADKEVKSASTSELNLENVGGVFVVLFSGVAIGFLFGIMEFIWKSLKLAQDERQSIVNSHDTRMILPVQPPEQFANNRQQFPPSHMNGTVRSSKYHGSSLSQERQSEEHRGRRSTSIERNKYEQKPQFGKNNSKRYRQITVNPLSIDKLIQHQAHNGR
ncbi:hypothetical protein BLOT_010029 [Blomia tropicalis]|nr:hypothetical protein BLOT_010029 [Blomia tropicalis]